MLGLFPIVLPQNLPQNPSEMAGKVRYLIRRGHRHYARIVVPERLRPIVGKIELSAPLGSDRRDALRKLPAVISKFQKRIAAAEQQFRLNVAERSRPQQPHPLTIEQMARIRLSDGLAFDDELRNSDPRYLHGLVDEQYVRALREVRSGIADDRAIQETLGFVIDWFRRQKNHDYTIGSVEWRRLARSLAYAELTVLSHIALRDEGYPDPDIPSELRPVPGESDSSEVSTVSIRDVFEGYRRELAAAGKAADAAHRWAPIIEDLVAFLGHDDARLIKRRDMLRWKDHLLERLSPKTVRDAYLSTIKAAFNWALDNELVESNPAAGVKVRLARKILNREKGLTDTEALAVLQTAYNYRKPTKENDRTAAAKRWAPLLCAFTGARIAEITQLRAQDIHRENSVAFIRITPEAGTVKTGRYRDVPLHLQVIELGFLDFVKTCGLGPLFYRDGGRRERAHASRIVADRVAKWIRQMGVLDASVQPNHGWRHRFKTQGRALGIDSRVLDCIQGHAAKSAADDYGDVTLATKQAAINLFPPYEIFAADA